MPELRRDPITRGWVIFAPRRSKRPSDFFSHEEAQDEVPCPFCPKSGEAEGNEESGTIEISPPTEEFEDAPWSMKVLKDKYPLLNAEEDFERYGEGMYDLMQGYGHHQLIIEAPEHGLQFHDFSEQHLAEIFGLYQRKMIALARDKGIQHILITRNIGNRAGAHIHHPHSHVVALPVVPKKLMEEIEGARIHYQYRDRCIFCDIVQQELSNKERVVLENDSFVAFCSYASRFPFEVTVIPKLHLPRFETIRPEETLDLAKIMKPLIGGLNSLLKDPPLNYIVHSAPTVHAKKRERFERVGQFYHWHIELLPKLTKVAGFEWGSGFYINPMLPEDAAEHLRAAVENQQKKAGKGDER